jgi:hypothetical protein
LLRNPTAILFSIATAAFLACTGAAYSQQQSGTGEASASGADTIVNRMEEAQQRNRDHYRPYTLTREYKLYEADEKKPKSEVLANISFVPPDRKTFTIEKSEGSGRGLNIVKHVLEGEAQATASPSVPGAISRRNYDFKLLGEDVVDGQACWVLQLLPKRDDKLLIRGRAWVDKNSYYLHQIQGELAKSPSWWLKKVDTTVHFSNAAGMWLQTATRAVADVRMFGRHVMTAQAIKLQTDDQVAERFTSKPPVFVAGRSVAGAKRSSNVSKATIADARVKRRPLHPVPALVGAGVLQ